jgi:hypothetical protein
MSKSDIISPIEFGESRRPDIQFFVTIGESSANVLRFMVSAVSVGRSSLIFVGVTPVNALISRMKWDWS